MKLPRPLRILDACRRLENEDQHRQIELRQKSIDLLREILVMKRADRIDNRFLREQLSMRFPEVLEGDGLDLAYSWDYLKTNFEFTSYYKFVRMVEWLISHPDKRSLYNRKFSDMFLAVTNKLDPKIRAFWHNNIETIMTAPFTSKMALRTKDLEARVSNIEAVKNALKLNESGPIYKLIFNRIVADSNLDDLMGLDEKKIVAYMMALPHGATGLHHLTRTLLSDLRRSGNPDTVRFWRIILNKVLGSPFEKEHFWLADNVVNKSDYDWYCQQQIIDSIDEYFSKDMDPYRREFWITYARAGVISKLPVRLERASATLLLLKSGRIEINVVEFDTVGCAYIYERESFNNIVEGVTAWEMSPATFFKITDRKKASNIGELAPALIASERHSPVTPLSYGSRWKVGWQAKFARLLEDIGVELP